ncbi:ATP-binding protein [Candidatus Aminicenantes bacterium AH-873-B07]|jgi:two-component system sensor histidine kinase PilS (NtrC family)|nr:ATP-binding protein [Candidatus Aminicenantes bacterium AH-873-B07]
MKNKILRLIIYRIIIITTLLGSAFIIQFITATFLSLKIIYFLVSIIYGLSILYFLLYYLNVNYSFQAYLQLIFDILIATGFVYFSGGLISPFIFLYVLPIITSSIILHKKASYIIASFSVIMFGGLVDLMYFKVIPFFIPEQRLEISFFHVLYNILVSIIAFFAIAFLSNYLAENLKKTGEKLREAQKELFRKEKLAAVGEMAVGLAHELRNPLAAISGSIQVLNSELKLKGEHENLMNIVVKESKRLSQTMEQFLIYTFPKTHSKEKINLSEVLKETLTILEKEYKLSQKCQLIGNFNNSSIFYYGNKEQFKQIFWNLITNSLQSFSGKGLIEINLFRKNNKEIEIQVKDNGRGMSEEEKERIFDPFFSRFERGKGLGMAIVYRIVQEYEGKINIFSELGKGTEIKIKLPVLRT